MPFEAPRLRRGLLRTSGPQFPEKRAAGTRCRSVLVAFDTLHDHHAAEAHLTRRSEHLLRVWQVAEAEKAVGGAREVVDLLDGAEARAQRDLRPQLAQGEDLRHEALLAHEADAGLLY